MRTEFIATVVLCLLASGCASKGAPVPAEPHFSVLTYNVNFGGPRPDLAVRAIAAADADVVCLQETTPAWEQAVRQGVGDKYPFIHFRHEGGAGGMAVLSKWEAAPEFYQSDAGWFPACVATVRTPAGPLRVVSVHLRPPVSDRGSFASGYWTTRAVRREEIEQIYAAALQPDLPTVFVGDFNEGGGGRAVRFLSRQGYRDALHQHAPNASTWRWYLGPLPLRGQLDHVLYGPSLHCLDARVLREGASDHYPVLATFRFQESRTG